MTYFIKAGNTYKIADSRSIEVTELLKPGNYVVNQNPQTGEYYLEEINAYKMPSKVYGASNTNRDRIITTFLDREAATGVLLSGEKGSGKTLLTKSLANELALNHNVPTLVINSPFCGDVFNKFIQTIEQPCVILFDEFEKVYDDEDQQKILTLLDGVFPSKKLFLLTINSGYIDSHMRNRPGRIYYQISFKGLDEQFIREYCQDNLKVLDEVDKLVEIASCFSQFNFDMLKAIVEDMNRYNEPVRSAMSIINARLEFDSDPVQYDIEVMLGDKKLPPNCYSPTSMTGSPLAEPANGKTGICFYGHGLRRTGRAKDDKEVDRLSQVMDDLEDVRLHDDNIIKVSAGGTIAYEFDVPELPKIQIRLTRRASRGSFNFHAF